MPKITTSNAKSLIIKYILKIVFSSVITVTILSVIFSFVTLKTDLDLKVCEYFGIVVCIASSFVISSVSIRGFKNNYLLLSMISIFPLLIFVIINFCIRSGNTAIIAIKILSIITTAFISALLKSKKKSR